MRITYTIIGLIVAGALVTFLSGCENQTKVEEKRATETIQDSTSTHTDQLKENPFHGLRNMAFGMTPEQLQISLPKDKTTVFGVVMDWGMASGTATLVSYQTGDASVYLSSGGAVIGGGQHEKVNAASKQFVQLAQSYLDKTTQAESHPLPRTDEVKFYLLTNNGTYTARDIMQNFENRSSAWLPLFEEGNKVMSELRLTTENRD